MCVFPVYKNAGHSLLVLEEEKLKKKKERFGTVTSATSVGADDSEVYIEKMRKRVERFGMSVSPVYKKMIEDILKTSPGGEKIASEYARTKSLSDSRRRDMVKILVAHLTNEHGIRPLQHLREQYAKGIISLFPNLADPRSKLGYEHYYNAEDGSGFLAWRIKTLQKEASEGRKKRQWQPQTGGPSAERYPHKGDSLLNDELHCQKAFALMKHTADEAVVKEKMRLTLAYRQKLLHDPKESTDILSIFPTIPGYTRLD
ncbi:uncharacterized protein LOC124402555 isoform X2 [Silurus meridionalis]|uniref:uncharacterized protein LOC124402555 isoform X2 n=1 Tax=Silurus meridionalis TaxID=175797 RepID=UPI001EECB7D1|nr:uncharacterized protein LOC124402555 isoform X2 [Silurus meridionalis]